MFQMLTAVSPIPSGSGHRLDDRAGQDQAERQQRHQHDHRQGDRQLQWAQLPERPSLGGLVDDVGGADEGADVAGGRPQRHRQAEHEGDAGGALVRGDRFDRPGEGLGGGGRADFGDDLGQAVGRAFGVADQTDQRDHRDQGGEEREQPVVGERRRPVGEVVLLELARGALQRRPGARLVRSRCVCRVVHRSGLSSPLRTRESIQARTRLGARPDPRAGAPPPPDPRRIREAWEARDRRSSAELDGL